MKDFSPITRRDILKVISKGFRYYRRAAELGNLGAMCDLGLMLLNGDVEAMEYLDSWFTCKKA